MGSRNLSVVLVELLLGGEVLGLLDGGVGDLGGHARALPDGVVDGGLVLEEVGSDDARVDDRGALQGRHAPQEERALQEESR